MSVKVIFSDESGQNITLVKPTQCNVEVILNQDGILDFPKGPHVFIISHLNYQSWISVYTF